MNDSFCLYLHSSISYLTTLDTTLYNSNVMNKFDNPVSLNNIDNFITPPLIHNLNSNSIYISEENFKIWLANKVYIQDNVIQVIGKQSKDSESLIGNDEQTYITTIETGSNMRIVDPLNFGNNDSPISEDMSITVEHAISEDT